MVYAVILGYILQYIFGLNGANLIPDNITIMTFVSLAFKLISEELIKFIPFMFLLRLSYKFSAKRKFSTILSIVLVMIFFAFLHAANLQTFLFAIGVQGIGSIFEFIGYIKTKNLVVSYITHLCTDIFIFLSPFLGI